MYVFIWVEVLLPPTPLPNVNQQVWVLIFSCEFRGIVKGRAVLVDCSGTSFAVVVVEVAAEQQMLSQHGV